MYDKLLCYELQIKLFIQTGSYLRLISSLINVMLAGSRYLWQRGLSCFSDYWPSECFR